MALDIGAMAPLFTAPMDGNTVFDVAAKRGSSFVLYFYPTDDTETCTKQACAFRDGIADFDARGVEVYGISPDDVKSHDAFINKYSLPFHLIADPDLSICNAYDVWHEKTLYGRTYMGVVRTTYLIDEKGAIANVWTNVRIKGHIESILAAIDD